MSDLLFILRAGVYAAAAIFLVIFSIISSFEITMRFWDWIDEYRCCRGGIVTLLKQIRRD